MERISNLNKKSESKLLKRLSMKELSILVNISNEVMQGITTVVAYRNYEKALIEKYGFKVI